jgi:glycosyltransferase involved in cell wall biosynthesis
MTSRYRVTFVTIVPSPYQRDLFAALAARRDVDLSVYYMEAASPDSPWPEAPLRPFERILPGFWVPFGAVRFHFNWSPPELDAADVVVLSSFTSWTGQWLMRRGLRAKRWLFWGERLRSQSSGWREIVQRRLIAPVARATGIVGIGRDAEDDYARRFPGMSHYCIPYHCDLTEFLARSRDRESGEPLVFLFCGQMIRRKGVDLLLAAFDRLAGKGLDVELRLVGREADLPEFLKAVSPAARARIHYEGFQPPERLPCYFARSDVFVLPSRHDGWGVVVNQALGAGLPVITSDAVGAGLDLVEDGVNGLKCAAGDLDDLEKCMERIASRPDEARRWGEVSRRKAASISPEAGAEKWVRVFDSLAKGT